MNNSSITIRWENNPDGSTDISVSGDIDALPHFRETFISLERPYSIHDIGEENIGRENAANSATTALLTNLTDVIRNSSKTSGRIITEGEQNQKFPFIDLITIRKFALLSGISIDETKFKNLMEFKRYFQTMFIDKNKSENKSICS